MDTNTSLARLKCNRKSTLVEIKSQYRKLSKLLHPDLNPNKSAVEFILLHQAYTFLLQNYVAPEEFPKPEGQAENYYRIIDPASANIKCILDVPPILANDAYIYFMQGEKEFRVLLKKGTMFPTTISITNLSRPLIINITNHVDMWV